MRMEIVCNNCENVTLEVLKDYSMMHQIFLLPLGGSHFSETKISTKKEESPKEIKFFLQLTVNCRNF